MDVVSADHTAHRGVWHKNPGPGSQGTWLPNLIYRDIRLPGDFVMTDIDKDGDLDWVGTSLTLGQAFIVEQVQPASGVVTTISLPDSFSGQMTKLLVTLATSVPVTGMPVAVLAAIDNTDKDGDGVRDLDQILSPSRDLVLAPMSACDRRIDRAPTTSWRMSCTGDLGTVVHSGPGNTN